MSAIFSRVCDDLLAYCRAGTWALVEGEPGTGKLTLAEAVHRRCTPEGSLTVIADGDVAASLSRAESAAAPRTVILRHADRFTSGELTAILAWADTVEGRLWLVATARAGTDLPGVLLHRMPVTLTMPPLRHRIDDVRDLVPVLLGRFAVGRSVSCGPEAMRMLLRARWPGNVTELVQALRHALTRRRIGEIQPSDLPESCQTTGRHALSHWETLERDAIIRTLRETNGDKGAAADLLGISRATIYRRISKYGIATSPQ